MKKINYTVIFLLTCYNIASAQNTDYLFKHITTENGLISNHITAICQDSKGFIWIGTQTGLQRYDGKRFITYFADVHNPNALHSDWISAIFEDSKKRLWIGSDQGAPYLFDRSAGKFLNYNSQSLAGTSSINGVWQFLEDSQKHIWVAAYNNYFKINDATNKFEPMDSLLHMAQALPSGISMDKTGDLWFATTAGVKKLSVKTNILSDKNNNPGHLAVFDIVNQTGSVAFDNLSNIWISCGYEGILYKYNFITNKLNNYSFNKLINPSSKNSYNYPVGQPFISSKSELIVPLLSTGIAIYDYSADSFNIIKAKNTLTYGLHLKPLTNTSIPIIEDKQKNVWLGSDDGINISGFNKPDFITYNKPSNASDILSSAEVSDFLQTKDSDIYVSYYVQGGGIVRFDKNLHFKKRYLFKENENDKSNQLWNLFEDKDGIIWAPNQGGTILKLNSLNNKLSIYKDSLLSGNINQIQEDAQGNIWIGHWYKGLIKIEHDSKKIRIYKNFNETDLNQSRKALCFLLDGDKVWVGTAANGLQLFDMKSKTFIESFRLNEKNNESISNNNITNILAYNIDTLIVATQGGINIFNKNKKVFTAITSKEGLPNNLIQAITLDDNKNLWAAFYGGLSKINLQTLAITNYDEDDGIINNHFNNRFYKLYDGRLMIGNTEGFMVFNPSEITETNTAPDAIVTGFKVFDKNIKTDSFINIKKDISLAYTDNSFHFEFASLQFNSPNKIKYYYRLTGVDKDWLQADETQTANYNQIQPGHYVFEVKCVARNGSVSKRITSLSIHIIPPFWERWWFITLAALLFAFALFFIIRWREKNFKEIEAGKTRLQQLTAEKYKAQLESEQITNFFTTSLLNKNDVDDVLWDVAKNLIGKLGFVDCVIYLWNSDKTKMIQKAGYGPKGSLEELEKQVFDVLPGQGVVGAVIASGEAIIIPDTSIDKRYRVDELVRASELCVPINYNGELIGAIDSEHYNKDFFTKQHVQLLATIATLVASKIKSIEAEQNLRHQQAALADINQQLAEVQLAALRSQMNPHFIFNALNSIKKFVIANEPANAEKYLGKFSKLIRSILDNSQSGMVTIEKELQLLKLYLDLEQLRFGTKLTYTIEVDENIDTLDVKIPSMIVQPFVENAMLHGIMHLDDGGKIDIRFLLHNDWLQITIEDNGIGRAKSALYKTNTTEPHHSIGIKVAAKRLEALKKNDDTPAGIEIVDLYNQDGGGCGTKVIISIPI